MKKKILILANNSGGFYDFRHELVEELMNKYEVVASTPFDDKIPELNEMGCRLIQTEFERRGMNPVKDIKLLFTYIKMIMAEKPDMVITYTIKPNVYGGLVCRLLKIPYYANITGLGTAFQNDGMLRKIVTVMYKEAFKKVRKVFFENTENRDILVSFNIISKDKTCVLNGAGVNLERYKVQEYPKNDETKFLFIGRIMKEKGVDELFEAMQRLKKDNIKCSLDVLGEFDEDYSEKIKKYEAEGWLHFYGYQKDVHPFINSANCFVLPSWHEGMANTNLECAASARPVITSNIHGCLEAVEDGVTGFLCEKQNADDLYKVMKRFTELSFDERKAMGLAGRKRMEDIFDKKKVVEETIRNMY